jgi:hypothetical protein
MTFALLKPELPEDLRRPGKDDVLIKDQRKTSLRPVQIVAALKISIYDGFFAQAFATLTGGVFLPAFALALGANNFHIGVLAAVPFFANLFQLAGSFFVEKFAVRKKFCIAASGLQRVLQIDLIFFSLAGLKIIFLLTSLLRFAAMPFLRPVKEPKGMRTLHAIRILRSVKSWALMMGDHPALQFFVSEDRLSPSPSDHAREESIWPLFGRKKVVQKSTP